MSTGAVEFGEACSKFQSFGLLWLVVAIGVASCTSPNPRSCADGLCTDQALPFCDEDGSFAGVPQTCIAVDCTPDSFVRCLGDRAVSCNSTGNDYEFDNCPNGCNDATGCRTCSSSDQCTASAPICDASGSCRTCAKDDECSSLVCEAGSCVAEAGILYVSPGGSDNSACSRAEPCSWVRGLGLARGGGVPPLIRMLPGTYVQGIFLEQATSAPLRVVGTGALIAAPVGLSITNGASVVLRGGSISSTQTAILCGASGQPEAKATFRDGVLAAVSTSAELVRVEECAIEISGSDLQMNASNGTGVLLTTNGRFGGDRLRVSGSADGAIGVGGVGSRMSFGLTNSLLEGVGLVFQATDSADPGSYAAFAYNTFVLKPGSALGCSGGFGSAHRTMILDNNIISGANVLDVVEGNTCVVRSNVLFPSVGRPANVTAPPLFQDGANRNFHLMLGSPAIDAATATPSNPGVSADLDGVSRPQGAKPDIGAFERVP